ncbi:MAG TPA: NAD-dependent epimerase/dehydratase family protein [Polyangiales bacterium]|nr:NAD-dependent epimerase/dehydratase family protein [Polyangiales bacterium]
MTKPLIVVTGAGGFIGGHLVAALRRSGDVRIRAVDIRSEHDWYQRFPDVESLQLDLRLREACFETCQGATDVYQLAADMGGMGFIESHKAECMLSVMINTHMLLAAREHGVKRFFYSSSACAYNVELQRAAQVVPLKEADAYPALPEDGYGWEKLFSERMCRHFTEDFGLYTRVARFHNVYGPFGTWDGGREKAPAAICRKVIEAAESGEHVIDIWGTGEQTRSFMYVDDCIHGIRTIMDSPAVTEPINLGSSELVTINQLVTIAERFAGFQLERRYDLGAPKGVNGRNSDNTLIREKLGWEPSLPLEQGLRHTYDWIYAQFRARRSGQRVAV